MWSDRCCCSRHRAEVGPEGVSRAWHVLTQRWPVLQGTVYHSLLYNSKSSNSEQPLFHSMLLGAAEKVKRQLETSPVPTRASHRPPLPPARTVHQPRAQSGHFQSPRLACQELSVRLHFTWS